MTSPKPLGQLFRRPAGRHAITPCFGVVIELWDQRMHLVAPFGFLHTIAMSGADIVATVHVPVCTRCALAALVASCPSARGGL